MESEFEQSINLQLVEIFQRDQPRLVELLREHVKIGQPDSRVFGIPALRDAHITADLIRLTLDAIRAGKI